MNIDLEKTSGNRDCFKVPEHYFEDFEAKLEARIDAEEASKQQLGKQVFLHRVRPVLYAAAMIVLLFVGTLHITNRQDRVEEQLYGKFTEEVNVESMTAEDILMSSMDEYSLMYYYLYEND